MMWMENLAGKRCQRRPALADNGAALLWAQSLARCLVPPTTIYAPVAVPILSLVGGAVGAFAGDALAKWVVDITYVGE